MSSYEYLCGTTNSTLIAKHHHWTLQHGKD